MMPENNKHSALIALTGRTLGALLYYSPLSKINAGLIEALASPGWESDWVPAAGMDSAAALIRQGLAAPWRDCLEDSYQQLFIGPHALHAPPWGSVYLDPEGVLFGESTLALRRWMNTQDIAVQKCEGEPEDHIGLMLMLAAWLAEHRADLLDVLLEQHILPWSGQYLSRLENGTEHPFYQGVAQLTRVTLAGWRQSQT